MLIYDCVDTFKNIKENHGSNGKDDEDGEQPHQLKSISKFWANHCGDTSSGDCARPALPAWNLTWDLTENASHRVPSGCWEQWGACAERLYSDSR